MKKFRDVYGEMAGWYMQKIVDIMRNCEEIQSSGESMYTKEQAKVSAYNEILEIISED